MFVLNILYMTQFVTSSVAVIEAAI